MKSVLVVSHGHMAEGIADTVHLFLGEEIEGFDHLCLLGTDDPETFGAKIKAKIEELDTGDGVIVLADLFGGTPFNQTLALVGPKVDLISGVNLPMLLELLGTRSFNDIEAEAMVDIGKQGIVSAKAALNDAPSDDDE